MRIYFSGILTLFLFLLVQKPVLSQTIGKPLHSAKVMRNSLFVSPLPMTALEGVTYFGGGIEYQRSLGRRGLFSVNVPVFAGKIGLQHAEGSLYTIAPAIKYHPLGATRRLDFAFGPQLLLGKEKYIYPDYWPSSWDNITGILLHVSLDMRIKERCVVGLYTAWGLYKDGSYTPEYYSHSLAIQLGAKLGFRF